MGVCKSTANDSCKSGKLLCHVSAILKGGFDATQAGASQLKWNHCGQGEFQRGQMRSILVS